MILSVAIPVMFLMRHRTGLRRFAAVVRNLLISLVRRFFAALLRWFAAPTRTRDFSVCGGSAALVSVPPLILPLCACARARDAPHCADGWRDRISRHIDRGRKAAPTHPPFASENDSAARRPIRDCSTEGVSAY